MMHLGARLAAAEHMGSSQLSSRPRPSEQHSHRGGGGQPASDAVRSLAQIEAKRKQAERLEGHEVVMRMQATYLSYCSKPRLVATGR